MHLILTAAALFFLGLGGMAQNIVIDKTFVKKDKIQKITDEDLMRSECSEVRLDAPGGVMSKMIETRQELGSCYAHSSIQLYDAWQIAHAKNNEPYQPSSVASAAYIYKKFNSTKDTLSGGNPLQLIQLLAFYQPCKMDKIKLTGSKKTYIDKKEKIADQFEKNIQFLKKETESLSAADSSYVKNRYSFECSKTANEKLTLDSQKKNFKDVLNIVSKNESLRALDEAKFFDCAQSHQKTKSAYITYFQKKKNLNFDLNYFKKINNQFNGPLKDLQPVEISYCSNLAYKIKVPSTDKDRCGAHSAIIIGRRIDPETRKCQFLIQDSGMPADYDTDNAKHISTKSQKMWVDAKSIVKNTTQMIYLKELKKKKSKP